MRGYLTGTGHVVTSYVQIRHVATALRSQLHAARFARDPRPRPAKSRSFHSAKGTSGDGRRRERSNVTKHVRHSHMYAGGDEMPSSLPSILSTARADENGGYFDTDGRSRETLRVSAYFARTRFQGQVTRGAKRLPFSIINYNSEFKSTRAQRSVPKTCGDSNALRGKWRHLSLNSDAATRTRFARQLEDFVKGHAAPPRTSPRYPRALVATYIYHRRAARAPALRVRRHSPRHSSSSSLRESWCR